MKPRHPYGAVALWCVMFFAFVPGLCAQQATVLRHTGAPQDWSQRQIVFSRDGLARHPDLIDREPRIRQQMMQRWQTPDWGAFHGVDSPLTHPNKSGLNRDWNVVLGSHLRVNAFPAKYSFDPGAPPDCTNDYVVFGLTIAGVDGGQANLVAFNNLYVAPDGSGYCTGKAPNVMFAYNVTTQPGGKIATSVVPSLEGTQIAFVETVPAGTSPVTPASARFHVLTWTAGQGTIGTAVTPTSAQMSTLTFDPTAQSTTSSPWVDFEADTAYMGADDGSLYQISPVFYGTPALSGAPNWPITVSAAYHLTPPVLDAGRGLLMVGSNNGNLYQIATANGAINTLVVGTAGGTSSGITVPPIVDVTNGTTFVVDANGKGGTAVLVETDTDSLAAQSTAPIGVGATKGTKMRLFQPAFSNGYYNNPSTGIVTLCGTGTGLIYDTIKATSVTSDVLTVTASNSFAVGEVVTIQGTKEGFLNGQTVTVASLIGTAPTYTGFTANFTASDYSESPDTGTASGTDTSPWQYAFGFTGRIMNELPAYPFPVQLSTDAGDRCTGWTEFYNPNISGGVDFFFFGLTGDCTLLGTSGSTTGCVVALSNKPYAIPTTSVYVDGGPSGIVVDNYSTAAQASSIYLTSVETNNAFKFTQDGLQ